MPARHRSTGGPDTRIRAAVVVLAERHGTLDVLTLDERHFRAITGSGGRPFRILPADG